MYNKFPDFQGALLNRKFHISQISHRAKNWYQFFDFGKCKIFRMVNFDNFGGLTSVLKFYIFLILTVKNWYAFVPSAKDRFDFSQM